MSHIRQIWHSLYVPYMTAYILYANQLYYSYTFSSHVTYMAIYGIYGRIYGAYMKCFIIYIFFLYDHMSAIYDIYVHICSAYISHVSATYGVYFPYMRNIYVHILSLFICVFMCRFLFICIMYVIYVIYFTYKHELIWSYMPMFMCDAYII